MPRSNRGALPVRSAFMFAVPLAFLLTHTPANEANSDTNFNGASFADWPILNKFYFVAFAQTAGTTFQRSPTILTCASLCLETPTCAAFSYRPDGEQCRLSQASAQYPQTLSNSTAAQREHAAFDRQGGAPAHGRAVEVVHGFAFVDVGAVVQLLVASECVLLNCKSPAFKTITTTTECAALCLVEAKCRSFSYHAGGQNCRLSPRSVATGSGDSGYLRAKTTHQQQTMAYNKLDWLPTDPFTLKQPEPATTNTPALAASAAPATSPPAVPTPGQPAVPPNMPATPSHNRVGCPPMRSFGPVTPSTRGPAAESIFTAMRHKNPGMTRKQCAERCMQAAPRCTAFAYQSREQLPGKATPRVVCIGYAAGFQSRGRVVTGKMAYAFPFDLYNRKDPDPCTTTTTTTTTATTTTATTRVNMNVLMLIVDDLRHIDAGERNGTQGATEQQRLSFGGSDVHSPNIDRLISKGAWFRNTHAQYASCGPSRSSFMTGRRPDAGRVYDLVSSYEDVNADLITLPHRFRQAGYYAVAVGKVWHSVRASEVGKSFDVIEDHQSYNISTKHLRTTEYSWANSNSLYSNRWNILPGLLRSDEPACLLHHRPEMQHHQPHTPSTSGQSAP